MKYLWIVVFAASYVLVSHPGHADITGPARQEFVAEAARSCMVKERIANEQLKTGVSEQALFLFCQCKAESIANVTSLEDVRKIGTTGVVGPEYYGKVEAAV